MRDRNRTGAQLVFLQGRVDACEKIVNDLQRRIEADKERIEELKVELRQGSDPM